MLDDESEPEPDFAIVPRASAPRDITPKLMLLAIEVADSSLEFDLGRKQRLYARHGVPEYWVLDVNEQVLFVHRRPTKTKYRSVKTLTDLSKVSPLGVPNLVLDLRRVFVKR